MANQDIYVVEAVEEWEGSVFMLAANLLDAAVHHTLSSIPGDQSTTLVEHHPNSGDMVVVTITCQGVYASEEYVITRVPLHGFPE